MVRDQIAALLFSTMTSKHKGIIFVSGKDMGPWLY